MTANELAGHPTRTYRHMGRDGYAAGVAQRLADLEELARRDGCVAAARALDFFTELREVAPSLRHLVVRSAAEIY